MTLLNFKKNIKKSAVLTAILLYGILAFNAGKIFDGKKGPEKQDLTNTITSTLEKPQPYLETQSVQVLPAQVKLCSNTTYSFQISYPNDWFTTYNTKEQECTFFAPFSFVVPQEISKDFTPIRVEVIPLQDWENTVKFYENPNDFYNVVSVKNLDVGGNLAKKVELTATGNGDFKLGFTKVAYLIFDSENPLVIYYQQLEEKEDTRANLKILDELIQSLKYF